MLLTADNRHAPPSPILPPSESPAPSSTATNPGLQTPARVDIDALINKVRRSLREDFLHLPATDAPPDDDDTPSQRLTKAALDLPPVDLNALERKIRCSSFELDDLTYAPTSCHDPTISCQPPVIPHHPQPVLHHVVHPDTNTTAPVVRPPAKPPDPDASPQSVPKCFQKPSNHRKHRTTPPDSLAPTPKRARITSYFCPNPGGSVPPSPSLSLPPFNPVLMCPPDKHTHHNFRPP